MSEPDFTHLNYVREFTELSLWYVHKRLCEGEGDFKGTVNGRVNIYRNTTLYDGKHHPSNADVGQEWASILNQLKGVFDRHAGEPTTAKLEQAGLNLLWPYLKKRRGALPSPQSRPYECWTYNYSGDRVHIHIFNVYQPASPLSDMYIPFAASLIRLLRDVQAEQPDIEVVQCGSWLNSSPPFQALFPECWKQNAEPRPDVRYTMGHWGQFISRQGGFHASNGTLFRQTGKFPFPNLRCESPIADVLAHLKESFPQAIAHNAQRLCVSKP